MAKLDRPSKKCRLDFADQDIFEEIEVFLRRQGVRVTKAPYKSSSELAAQAISNTRSTLEKLCVQGDKKGLSKTITVHDTSISCSSAASPVDSMQYLDEISAMGAGLLAGWIILTHLKIDPGPTGYGRFHLAIGEISQSVQYDLSVSRALSIFPDGKGAAFTVATDEHNDTGVKNMLSQEEDEQPDYSVSSFAADAAASPPGIEKSGSAQPLESIHYRSVFAVINATRTPMGRRLLR